MSSFKLGKKPARPDAVQFKLSSYLSAAGLPAAPPAFGHADLVTDYGMLGNDQWGDCVFAGADHETMLWIAESGAVAAFTEANALADYSALTGFNPADPNSDQGTDMEEAAKYRRKTGVVDAAGTRHQVGAYVALPGVSAKGSNAESSLDALASAAYAFGAVGVGIEFPSSAMDQFDQGHPWDVVAGSPIEGGHYIPVVGRAANGNFLVVTWGRVQQATPAFLLEYMDEAIVYLTVEFLNAQGVSIEGFDLAQLNEDIKSLGGSPIPAPTPAPTPAPAPFPPAPTPAPPVVPDGATFPLDEVDPWLNGRQYTHKGRRAQQAIDKWLRFE